MQSILFIGRLNCIHTKELRNFLKSRIKKLYFIESRNIGERLRLSKLLKQKVDLIISFRSFYILKKNELSLSNYGAINFHAGTPEYRGIGSLNFAIKDKFPFFGSTCHVIDKKIDNGPILDVKKFKLNYSKKIDLDKIILRTHKMTVVQAKKVLKTIIKNPKNIDVMVKKNRNIKWSKDITSLRDLKNLYMINKNVSKKELEKIILSTNSNDFKPYITIHGKKFEFKNEN
tara:strand:- start:6905 stop:7594 length:690 start_codon:yes stop_codon:yes gene_type:complete